MKGIAFEPIGYVSSRFRKPGDLVFACEKGLVASTESQINVMEKFLAGLDGLRNFSHLWVIYWLHRAERTELRTHPGPPSIKGLPKAGVFATRSQYRPNKIALRLARIVEVRKNTITVSGLDAIDGSLVLDVKPYVSHFDRPERFKEAEWYRWKP